MPTATRTFRVFVSSTFEDLKEERDAIQRRVFPELRELCERRGARFQAIDLRWGIRDEAALDQQTLEICLKEIRRCQATGVPPNFIVLLGDRYGWQPLPATITGAEIDVVLAHVASEQGRELAHAWYRRLDENAVPPEYRLQPRRGDWIAPAKWNPVEQALRKTLAAAARKAGLPPRDVLKYEASATHQEIVAGLGDTPAGRQHVFAFFRRSCQEADARAAELKAHLRIALPGNTTEFDADDLAALCRAVSSRLRDVITAELDRLLDLPPLDLEVEAHDRFAGERTRVFVGRRQTLDRIGAYIAGPERQPLVVHGVSGSGKSALMAQATVEARQQRTVIRRFVGASPESMNGRALLAGLCRQIAPGEVPVEFEALETTFRERLALATGENPLVLFVDGLDQLPAGDPARRLTWLPRALPPHVKLIVSTTPDGEQAPAGISLPVERLTMPDSAAALDWWLRDARRTLQPWQRTRILSAFERCAVPLYLKLAAEESRLWPSYASEEACALGEGVAGMIDTLVDRLSNDSNHGRTLVETSLGCLAAARYGLTEHELLDLLAEDDSVWRDFESRRHHEVSERRLPVVVWSRLSLDLEPYLSERAAPGGTVTTFYHRQVAERAAARFLAGPAFQARHTGLVRYFTNRGAWLDERHTVPDARRAVELPFHQREAGAWRAAEATLLDPAFLFGKCRAGLALDLDADFEQLVSKAPPQSLLDLDSTRLLHGALHLSLQAITEDVTQLAPHLVGRLLVHRDQPGLLRFLDALAAAAPRPWIRPCRPCFQAAGGALAGTMEAREVLLAVAVTPDGRRAISGSQYPHTLAVWDLGTGRLLRTLRGHEHWVTTVAVTPDGTRAVSGSRDHTLRVWDLASGELLLMLEGHGSDIRSVAVTPDGRRAISGSDDETTRVWDLDSGRCIRTFEGHSHWVKAVAVTPDGTRVVSAYGDGPLMVWELETGSVRLQTVKHRLLYGEAVTVATDGKLVVSSYDHKTLKVWNLETGRTVRTLRGHTARVFSVALSADGARAVSASEDRTLKVWDVRTGRLLGTLEGHSAEVRGVALTPDGKQAVSVSKDTTVKVWNLGGVDSADATDGHPSSVYGVSATPDRTRLVSVSWSKVKVLHLNDAGSPRTLKGFARNLTAFAVTPDGMRAVSPSYGNFVRMWDLRTGATRGTWEGHTDEVTAVAVAPDGSWAITGSKDSTLRVWDLTPRRWGRWYIGHAVRVLAGHTLEVRGVALTRDGKRAVSASMDGTLKVWDVETGQAALTFGENGFYFGVALTPDDKYIVSAAEDKTVTIWDVDTGRAVRRLSHMNAVGAVAVAPEGKRLVSASQSTLRLWDLDSGQLVAALHCDAPVICCSFVDDHIVAAGDVAGRVYILALEE